MFKKCSRSFFVVIFLSQAALPSHGDLPVWSRIRHLHPLTPGDLAHCHVGLHVSLYVFQSFCFCSVCFSYPCLFFFASSTIVFVYNFVCPCICSALFVARAPRYGWRWGFLSLSVLALLCLPAALTMTKVDRSVQAPKLNVENQLFQAVLSLLFTRGGGGEETRGMSG